LLPIIFPTGKTETRTRENVFSVPRITIEPIEKELDILGITGASSMKLEPIISGKELTGLWEGPRTEQLFPEITTDITSTISLITPIETTITTPIEIPLETSISLSKISMLSPTPITPVPFIEPGPSLTLGPIDFGGGGSLFEEPTRRGKGYRRNFFYTPSFTAIELDIHGPRPGRITGFEIRPITSGRRRRLF
jgi:hypothetical protein